MLIGVALSSASALAQTPLAATKQPLPTIVLVHGAFAKSSSWNDVIARLHAQHYPVIANTLRSVKNDSQYVAGVLTSIQGPVVLAGHSYSGEVITNAAVSHDNVKALVYVAGLAPDLGESGATLSAQFPGSTLGPRLAPPVMQPEDGKDLYIQRDKFRARFAADVPEDPASLMAATQRPVTEAALREGAGTPAWKTILSWFIYGQLDKNIPAAAHAFMARRASAKETVEVKGASHVVMITHPDEVAAMIERAAHSF